MAAIGRILNQCRILSRICQHNGILFAIKERPDLCLYRGLKNSRRWTPYLRELYKRRVEAGPEPEKHPSESGCWNYSSEMYAFGQRFGEEFNDQVLRTAFITSDYAKAEEENRKTLGLDENLTSSMEDNTGLAEKGQQIASQYIKGYLRHSYPMMLEEGIQAVNNYLLSDEILYEIASNLGLTDLIMSPVYPPDDIMYVSVFKAIIGAVAESQTTEKAELFVRDFVISHLCGKNLMEIWQVNNPMGLLTSLLTKQGRGAPEPRLLWQSGSRTLLSLYHVGIYSDQQLIGKSPGETVDIAEEMAARDALSNLMNINVNSKSLEFGEASQAWRLDYNRTNPSVSDSINSNS